MPPMSRRLTGFVTVSLLMAMSGCSPALLNAITKLQPSANPGQPGGRASDGGAAATPRPRSNRPVWAKAGRPSEAADDAAGLVIKDKVKDLKDFPNLTIKAPSQLGRRIPAAAARKVAERFLTASIARTGDKGPEPWRKTDAQLAGGPPAAYYDATEKEPTAFEFPVTDGKNAALGFITVNTSPYQNPIPEYSTEGSGYAAALMARFRKKFGALPVKPKLYRSSPFARALEDEGDPDRFVRAAAGGFDLKAFKASPGRYFYYPGEEEKIARRWQTATSAPSLQAQGLFHIASQSGSVTRPPQYYQFQQDNGCYIGCGPVGWAMIYGWWDAKGYNAVTGDASTQTSHVESMMQSLFTYLKTTCAYDSNHNLVGGTHEYWEYRGAKWGNNDRNLDVDYNYDTLYGESTLFERAQGEINDGRPVLLGFKDSGRDISGHVAVAYQHYEDSNDEWLTINTGWEEGTEFGTLLTIHTETSDCKLKWIMQVDIDN